MRTITILNGIADDSYTEFEAALEQASKVENPDRRLNVIRLRDLDIRYCTGCWDCWVKTPGVCAHHDDMPTILKEVIQSDLMVFLSPVSLGFVTALTKKACDRLIPLVHPYVEIHKKELHHKNRYKKYPKMGLILIDPEKSLVDFENTRQIFYRLSINLKTDFTLSLHLNGSEKEAHDAFSNL
jgi:multimeric flavodoxin WrbA